MEVRIEILTVAITKTIVFWFVAPCNLAEVYRRFIRACCLHLSPDNGGSRHV
jgi:hypothetical protein